MLKISGVRYHHLDGFSLRIGLDGFFSVCSSFEFTLYLEIVFWAFTSAIFLAISFFFLRNSSFPISPLSWAVMISLS